MDAGNRRGTGRRKRARRVACPACAPVAAHAGAAHVANAGRAGRIAGRRGTRHARRPGGLSVAIQPTPGLHESQSAVAVNWRTMMFDPVSYIHAAHFVYPARFASPRQRAVINEMLIAGFHLDVHWPFDHVGMAERPWVLNWRRLPQVAYLMGCQARKASLCRRAALLRLPAWAFAFTQLPVLDAAPSIHSRPPSDGDLLAEGFARLMALAASLRAPLRQRLPLLFPRIDPCAGDLPDSFDVRLFVTALQYAKNHPHSPPDSGR
ncbi:type III secretion apparatus protein OrgA/MxiK [Pandoraea pnomenusa]|nr:type III secretion apparatus protein OrgA/MxiK [Pandoraea pnomenusa]